LCTLEENEINFVVVIYLRYVWNYGSFINTISSVYQSLIREGML